MVPETNQSDAGVPGIAVFRSCRAQTLAKPFQTANPIAKNKFCNNEVTLWQSKLVMQFLNVLVILLILMGSSLALALKLRKV